MVSLPQIGGQLLQHHLLRGLRAAACRAAADLVLPEPRRQQGRLVVQAPTEVLRLVLHPLRLPAAIRRLPSRRGCQLRPCRRRQATEHLVQEVVVHAARSACCRAQVVEGDLACGGHGLHFPRGLHPSLVAMVYEPAGG
jgi:hypothetical protein